MPKYFAFGKKKRYQRKRGIHAAQPAPTNGAESDQLLDDSTVTLTDTDNGDNTATASEIEDEVHEPSSNEG